MLGDCAVNDIVAVAIGVVLGVSAAIPVALVVVMAARQPRDMIDFTGWTPPDEIIETTAVALYFDAQWREVTP